MNIHLHIGIPKTGNQFLIQTIGWGDNDKVRRDSGVLFVNGFYDIMSHVRTDDNIVPLMNGVKDLWHIVERHQMDKLYIISEALSGFPTNQDHRGWHTIAQRVKKIFEGHNIHITLSIRRQDTFIESVYTQYVKEGGYMPFNVWYENHEYAIDEYCHYGELVEAYAPIAETLRVIPYELHYERESWIRAMFSGFITGDIKVPNDTTYNPGLSREGLEILRRSNQFTHGSEIDKIRLIMQEHYQRRQGEPIGVMPSQLRVKIINKFAAHNSELLKSCPDPRLIEYYTSDSNVYNDITNELAFELDMLHKRLDIKEEGR